MERQGRFNIGGWLRRVVRGPSWLAQSGYDLLLPPSCAVCGVEIDAANDRVMLCPACRSRLGPEVWIGCQHCGTGLSEAAPSCGWCRRHTLHFDAVVPLGRYEDELREAVLRTKRPAGHSLLMALANHLAQQRARALLAFGLQAIDPVPMHWRRRVWTGMNNADGIDHFLSHRFQIPLVRCLRRNHNTRPQKHLGLLDRFRNVRGAFAVCKGYDLRGTKVLLVDDVLTTGATCSSAAEVLKGAGASLVVAAVLARADGEATP